MAKRVVQFDKSDDAGMKYAVLDIPYSQKGDARKVAEDLGNRDMISRKVGDEWRLAADLVPKGVNAKALDAAFGQWKTPEAAAAVAAEKEAFAERKAAKVTVDNEKPAVDFKLVYFPERSGQGKKDWETALAPLKDAGLVVGYQSQLPHPDGKGRGGFVAEAGSGPTTGLEVFQTDKARADWVENGRVMESRSQNRLAVAGTALDAQRAEVEHKFLGAASVNGLSLANEKSHPAQFAAGMALIKAADNTELSVAFQTTDAAKNKLENIRRGKQITVIQKQTAVKKGSALTPEEEKAIVSKFFNLDDKGQRAAAGYVGLNKPDYEKLEGLKNGFFPLHAEMVARNLMPSKEMAQEAKQERINEASQAVKQEKPAQTKAVVAEKAPAPAQTKGHGLAAALANAGQER